MSKYKSRKTTVDGITFDSKKEAKAYQDLKMKEESGLISDLTLQPSFELIPSQPKACIRSERPCTYRADFSFIDEEGNLHVIDVKGVRTEVYRLKRKLMRAVHGIEIEEW